MQALRRRLRNTKEQGPPPPTFQEALIQEQPKSASSSSPSLQHQRSLWSDKPFTCVLQPGQLSPSPLPSSAPWPTQTARSTPSRLPPGLPSCCTSAPEDGETKGQYHEGRCWLAPGGLLLLHGVAMGSPGNRKSQAKMT